MTHFKSVIVLVVVLFQIASIKAEANCVVESNFQKLTAQSDTIIDSIQACNSHTWIDGITYYQSNYSAIHVQSPDTVYKLALTIDSLDVQVHLVGSTLYSSVTNAVFQWVDCDNNYAPIVFQNASTFTPTQNGNYAVIAVTLNCSDTSNCVALTNIGIDEVDQGEIIEVYPNPSKGIYRILGLHSGNYSVYNAEGALLLNNKIISGGTPLDLSKFPIGVYTLILEDSIGNTSALKLLKN